MGVKRHKGEQLFYLPVRGVSVKTSRAPHALCAAASDWTVGDLFLFYSCVSLTRDISARFDLITELYWI